MTVPAHDGVPYDSVPYDTDIAPAAALEAIGLISPALPVRTLRQSREAVAPALRRGVHRLDPAP
jgi:hypothetical protein